MTNRAPSTSTNSQPHDDTGAITIFGVVIAMALLLIVGLVVDGAGKVHARQQAAHAAQEAARAAGQELDLPAAVRGNAPTLDTAAAARAARNYLTAAGINGTVTVSGNTITVNTTTTYQPIFVSLVGIGPMTVTGTASARPVRGVTQEVP